MLLNEPVDNPAIEMVFTNYALRNMLYGIELQVFVKCLYIVGAAVPYPAIVAVGTVYFV